MTSPASGAQATAVDYGERLRLGLMVPSGNVVAEPEIGAMLPTGAAPYVTRLALTDSSEAALLAMASDVDQATDLLAHLNPNLIMFHCTAVTTFAPSMADQITSGITHRSGIPATTTAEAIVAALRHLDVRRVALLTPYITEVHAREIAFLEHHGITVSADSALGITSNADMAGIDPNEIREFVLQNRCPDADAYLLSCTAWRTANLIGPLEQILERPVVTSNQAAVWHVLRLAGLHDSVPGFGRLLRS